MKKIFFILLIIFFVFIIYFHNTNTKKFFLSIGDFTSLKGTYNNNIERYLKNNKVFQKSLIINNMNYRTTDIISIIKENTSFNNMKIQNVLIKADYIVLAIGQNDILSIEKLQEQDILEIMKDMKELYSLLRLYSKEKIIAVGIYNSYSCNNSNLGNITNLNNYFINISKEYNINYINILKELNENKYGLCNSAYPNNMGNNAISSKLIDLLN